MDSFHILRGGSSLDSIKLVPPGMVAVSHWNDLPATKPFPAQEDEDRIMPGGGVTLLRQIEAVVRQQGYQGHVSLEMFNHVLWARNPEEAARLGLEWMQTYFAG